MADVWETTSWADRDFAESLGLWEVNVYKALTRWNPEWKVSGRGSNTRASDACWRTRC